MDNISTLELSNKEFNECLWLLQDINIVESLIGYEYSYFAIVYPSVSERRYKFLKNIVEGKHDKIKAFFLQYFYHNYKNDSDGYRDYFDKSKYERLPTCKFRRYNLIYTFKGSRFDFCEVVNYAGIEIRLPAKHDLQTNNEDFNKILSENVCNTNILSIFATEAYDDMRHR